MRESHQKPVTELINVGNNTAHSVSNGMRIDIGKRQLLNLVKGISAKSAHDSKGNSVVANVHKPLTEGGQERDHANMRQKLKYSVEINVTLSDCKVNCLTHKHGNVERTRNGGKSKNEGYGKEPFIGFEVS